MSDGAVIDESIVAATSGDNAYAKPREVPTVNDVPAAGPLPASCNVALKEWAAVGRAIAAGSDSLLIRAGGIDDPAGRFGFSAGSFWLFPTRYHEAATRLVPSAAGFAMEAGCMEGPPAIDLLLQRVAVRWVDSEELLERLAPLHVLAPEVVAQRFSYRTPGVAVALVEAWRRAEPHFVEETPEMAGCKSWLSLPRPLSCDLLEPVLPVESRRERAELFFGVVGGGPTGGRPQTGGGKAGG